MELGAGDGEFLQSYRLPFKGPFKGKGARRKNFWIEKYDKTVLDFPLVTP
jgi:hypothetical protein